MMQSQYDLKEKKTHIFPSMISIIGTRGLSENGNLLDLCVSEAILF